MSAIDPKLAMLLAAFEERHKNGLPTIPVKLTLQVGGFLVTGTLIPEDEFSHESYSLLERISEGFQSGLANTAIASNLAASGIENEFPKFIHLRDTRLSSPHAELKTRFFDAGMFWRGRLESVDAFCISNDRSEATPFFPSFFGA